MSRSDRQFEITKPEQRKLFLGNPILFLAIRTMLKDKDFEHNTVRVWRGLIPLYLNPYIFGATDQYYTPGGVPDHVYELPNISETTHKIRWVPRLYCEFKGLSKKSPEKAIQQTLKSIQPLVGKDYARSCYVLGVVGRRFMIKEVWHYVEGFTSENEPMVKIFSIPINARTKLCLQPPNHPSIRGPITEYAEEDCWKVNEDADKKYELDLIKDKDETHRILTWIGNGLLPRNFSAHIKGKNMDLPESVTMSTLASEAYREEAEDFEREEDEQPLALRKEMLHAIKALNLLKLATEEEKKKEQEFEQKLDLKRIPDKKGLSPEYKEVTNEDDFMEE